MRYHIRIAVAALAALAGGACAWAEDCLTVIPSNGTERVQYRLDDISRITFDGDGMKVEHADGTDTLPLGDIDSMRFDVELEPDAVEQVLDDGLTVSAVAGTVHIQAPDGRRIEVAVYDIQGRCLQTLSAEGRCAVDMSGKAPGIYIVKANDTTIKYRN